MSVSNAFNPSPLGNHKTNTAHFGEPNASMTNSSSSASDDFVQLDGETYFRILDSHRMPDFFMSLVGASDHWMFISSRGALTAGRCDPDSALFPYLADDQITASQANTGSMTLIRNAEHPIPWTPFLHEARSSDRVVRNLYKTPLGNKLVLEEINVTRQLAFRYRWVFSETFGFVRSCCLTNLAEQSVNVELLDGLANLLPYGVGSEFGMRFSNLANAYKKNEWLPDSGLGLFYLSSIPTDRAEPSEGLKATTVWQTGLQPQATLVSSEQLHRFAEGAPLESEVDVRGKAGAYLLNQTLDLQAGESLPWSVIAEVSQDHSSIIQLDQWLKQAVDHAGLVEKDIAAGQTDFSRIVASSDGFQCSQNRRRANRHLSSTVFNVMRGGVPLQNYQVDREDFRQHIKGFNRPAFERYQARFDALPEQTNGRDLSEQFADIDDIDLKRLTREYLPLAFSRRHGDPTRPWNRFAIQLRTTSGRTNLDYQGNWRDIFQNWEALAHSFPEFSTAMICRFLNATTADGYNPYRLTKNGFDWEVLTPDDPWANIGYWGDHQIIYLLKLLEWNRKIDPGGINDLLQESSFVHANIPYRIKPFEDIKRDPQNTIDFDDALAATIEQLVQQIGADGKLLTNQQGNLHRVTLIEKLLTLSLAKLSNFVPDGGIWLNTQRPEWNDANNALVGNGLSMVTTYYLRRWMKFLKEWVDEAVDESICLSRELAASLLETNEVLQRFIGSTGRRFDDQTRLKMVEALSTVGSDYRKQLYSDGPSGETTIVPKATLVEFLSVANTHIESTIRQNRRSDGLYHSYNLLKWKDEGVEVQYLDEMLEGQVAVLSSGFLSAAESNELLESLRGSALYRENQDSYLLYPDRQLPRFLEKNSLSPESFASSRLVEALVRDGNHEIILQDVHGDFHFNGAFRNASDLDAALKRLPEQYQPIAKDERSFLLNQFETHFNHHQFTGRSGTFFAYEGLGSIYWHMVSKLGLAIAETMFRAIDVNEDKTVIANLRDHYRSVRRGIGAEKTPLEYGAFPSDPYSHTPENAGAKQPGMTGQVKEDILARFLEVGIHFCDGRLDFRMDLFDHEERLETPRAFSVFDVAGERTQIEIPAGSFALTVCQVPIVYQGGSVDLVTIEEADGTTYSFEGRTLDAQTCKKLFSRRGQIQFIRCQFQDFD